MPSGPPPFAGAFLAIGSGALLWVLGSQLEVLVFGNVELLVQREIQALLAGSAHRADAGVAERAGEGSGVGRGVEEEHAGSDVVRIVGGADDIGAVAALAGAGGIAAVLDRQREAAMEGQDAAHLPAAEHAVHCLIPLGAELLALAEGQVVDERTGEVVLEVEVRRAPFIAAVVEVLHVGGLAARLAAFAVIADGVAPGMGPGV